MELCREFGVVRYSDSGEGVRELVFGPQPVSVAKSKNGKDETDPLAGKRAHYQVLLGRMCTDKELELLP